MVRELISLQTQPLKHAPVCLDPRNQQWDLVPVIFILDRLQNYQLFFNIPNANIVCIFGDHPDENSYIFLPPIFLDSLVLDYSTSTHSLLLYPILHDLLNLLVGEGLVFKIFYFVAVGDYIFSDGCLGEVPDQGCKIFKSITCLIELIDNLHLKETFLRRIDLPLTD